MSAAVEKVSQRQWQAWCPEHQDGLNCKRQVDAYVWAADHNRKEHST